MANINVLISASVPSKRRSDEFLKVNDAQINIEEAVIAVSRSICNANGRIIMGGHPSISPLIAMVSTEFQPLTTKETPNTSDKQKLLKIYQSRAFEGFLPDSTFILYNSGFAEIQWVNAVDNEKYDPDMMESQCRKSLAKLRSQMIGEDLDAMVCIGGMDGVLEEFKLFRERKGSKPVYLFKNTGGATYNLSSDNRGEFVRVYEDAPLQQSNTVRSENDMKSFAIFPYTFRAAEMVQEIVSRK